MLSFIATLRTGNRILGSGFLVHSATGLIATCYHVIRELGEPLGTRPLEVCFLDDTVWLPATTTSRVDTRHDIALIQLDTPRPQMSHPRLVRMVEHLRGAEFSLTAYGTIDDANYSYRYVSASGTIVGPAERDGIELLHLESRQILRGMSGSPVFVHAAGGVVGVLSERYMIDPMTTTFMRDTAWAALSVHLAALDSRLRIMDPPPPQPVNSGAGSVNIGGNNEGIVATSGATVITGLPKPTPDHPQS